jgi:hypothetical protein
MYSQGRPETRGLPRQANNLVPFKRTFFKTFSAQERASEPFWGRVFKLRIIFREILSRVDNLSLPAPCFRLLPSRLRAPYKLAIRATTRLARAPSTRPAYSIPTPHICCPETNIFHISIRWADFSKHTGPGAHPATCAIRIGLLPGRKEAGTCRLPTTIYRRD